MNTKELLASIEAESADACDYNFRAKVIPVSHVIKLINEAMEGKVIVPVEPTDEMLAEMWINDGFSHRAMVARYKAMLSTIDGDSHES